MGGSTTAHFVVDTRGYIPYNIKKGGIVYANNKSFLWDNYSDVPA